MWPFTGLSLHIFCATFCICICSSGVRFLHFYMLLLFMRARCSYSWVTPGCRVDFWLRILCASVIVYWLGKGIIWGKKSFEGERRLFFIFSTCFFCSCLSWVGCCTHSTWRPRHLMRRLGILWYVFRCVCNVSSPRL